MKRNQSFLPIILACCLYMVTGVSVAKGNRTIAVDLSRFAFFQDTIPPAKGLEKAIKGALPKIEAPKIEIPKVEPPKSNNLFKNIANWFKFRKNSQTREKKRVLEIFESLGINDSIAASSENIQWLIAELSERENQHFDSLLAIISEIKNRKPEVITILAPPSDKDEPGTAETSGSKVVTDKDIEDLTNKLLPLIAEKAKEERSEKDKRLTLSAIRKVRTDGSSDILTIADSAKGVIKRFRLRVKNRAEVYGLHNYTYNNSYGNYKFGALNTLVYNSIFINGRTGNIKDLNGWDTAGVITAAQRAGCNVVFTASIQQSASTDAFLASNTSRKKFIDNALSLIRSGKAKGVNIQFNGIHTGNGSSFTDFIGLLSAVLKMHDSSFKVLVTIPAYANTDGYNLEALEPYVDRFLVNFTTLNSSVMGPMTPLQGGRNSMKTVLSRFLGDVPAAKIIPSVSYTGTKWSVTPGKSGGRFIKPLYYSEIRDHYDWPVYRDDESASAMMDSLNKHSSLIRTIYFDDEVSLEKKYDYIIQSGMGGVVIDALGYDRDYGDLWDALSYKFAVIDTVYLKDSLMGKPLDTDLNFFERARRYLDLFSFVMNNPCEVCFESITDPVYAVKINRDLQELSIDSIILAKNRKRPLEEQFRSRFEYVNFVLTRLLGYLTLFMLLVTMIGTGIYLYKVKQESEEWKWKKKAEIILIGLSVLFVLCAFTYLFTNDTIPVFGAASKSHGADSISFSKDLSAYMALTESGGLPVNTSVITTTAADTATVVIKTDYCTIDPEDDCVNIPFPTLMAIIIVGMLIGILITRYLIMPLLRRNDIP